ncbi:hypothetical protein DL766_001335 [Monosporascus sp. MC13-8B]|uniref:phosphoinositide 5-phosphatase n=1 Tax=Monosporascus cannonballus TaxID=155416 RepID=A0ABY0HEA9_9PEZI|nr:hypothetical protein DL763_006243 [Monosporascus cannonballus]RYO91242.1 hypothetical protein DL762_002228 [Monosporascus cannonballus]RYP37847.1 hypothetical protein DL766_001335 [Monosporascus sp. MC13-8B]
MEQPPAATRNGLPAPTGNKTSQLLIRDYPHRAIAITTATHILIFRYSPTTNEAIQDGSLASVSSARPRATGEGLVSKCMVEFSPISGDLLSDFRPLTPRPIYGTLGLIAINQDAFLCVITHATRVATLRPGETVERILGVDFFCLNSADYDQVSLNTWDSELVDPASTYGQNLSRREGEIGYPYEELQKLLSNGTFYYSTDFDLTNRMQDRPVDSDTFHIDNFDDSFLWNSYMISPLLKFRSRLMAHERETLDASRILTSAIRGFCLTMTIPQAAAPLRASKTGLPSFLTVISRLSCKRAGTRFNSRGIDDDGNVANFVETETIYWSPSGVLFSYAQVRGSVPVFWEQSAGLIPGQQKITITRSADGTQPAFNKHFDELEQAYGAVHIVNLLSATKPGEAELTELFRYGVQHCPLTRPGKGQSADHTLLRETDYDFHAETRTAGYEAARDIRRYIENSAEGFAYYLAEETDDSVDTANEPSDSRRMVVVLQQEGVFRTNCLDCLDRTNLIQTLISQMAVEAFLAHRAEYATSDFWMRHSTLWADNGDALSRTYAGTGALKSSFTRHGKMSLAGAFADARKSATRLYINNFTDKARQNTIDLLLGRLVGQTPVQLYDPISDFVSAELAKRVSEYSSTETITIWVGTFNLNGRTNETGDDLSSWLWPPELGSTQPEIMVVGFQEIVELSAQQIMNSDPTRKQEWERAIKRTLNDRAREIGGEKYVLLRSGQLVGAALCIFVKASSLPKIKNVEGNVKKTGMSGIAGNKGAVGIRMEYASTKLCFVTAHLAAGFSNYDERNRDYETIHHGLRFQRNRGIDDHVMNLIKHGDIEKLYENDQIDTTLPWTDRILRKGTNIRQLSYNSAPLRFSDHRPVYATFQCTVNIVDEALREKVSRELYARRKADVGHPTGNLISESSDEEDLIGYDPVEPGLPAASSDRQRWWLENGKMAQSRVAPPGPPNSSNDQPVMVLNPSRPSNPFQPTDEPDWVAVPRSGSRLSSFSSISSSPYEQINHSSLLSTSASSSTPRKLPPPFDPAALPVKVGRLNLAEEQAAARSPKNEAPPPPPPRRQTAGPTQPRPLPVRTLTFPMAPDSESSPAQTPSTSMSINKPKPAPPVAKKPAHLASTSPTNSPPTSESGRFSPSIKSTTAHSIPRKPSKKVSDLTSRLESSGSGSLTGGMRSAPIPPLQPTRASGNSPSRNNSTQSLPSGGVSLPGLGKIERKPVMPSSQQGLSQPLQPVKPARKPAVDLLGDDEATEMGGWETLKPS